MIHSEDIIRWLKPNHSKGVMTIIFFFLYPVDGSFSKLMLTQMIDLINRFFLGQKFILVVWVYAVFVSYLFACVVYHVFVYFMGKYQKKPEHPLYDTGEE